jgi:hypothetical protein
VTDDGEGRRASRWLFGPALAWVLLAGGGLLATALDDEAWSAVDRRRSSTVGSADCRTCHPREHASWHRSYHRTMTQAAEGDAVLAPFAGEELVALGFRATMTRSGEGRPHVRIERLEPEPGVDPLVLEADVELTVGSHRYQQYVARIDRGGGEDERWRLPLAWHVELDRWIHINGAFLTPEGAWGEEADYLRHLSRWNDNCVFCHNTEPVPGHDLATGRFETRVAELGIACEACHGPASAHVERHAWPLRRLLAGGAGEGDGSIAHPGRLSPGLHADVCGRCHGNRIAADLGAVLEQGDGFLPGEPLASVSRPIQRESELADRPGERPFAPRFWPDGTPRLSAYEYQALLLSPCHAGGDGLGPSSEAGLSCGDCHTMHGPEPSMQLWAEHDTTAVCERCHAPASLSDAVAPGGHGRHGEAVGCDGCHLPRITYGLLEGMITHRPTRPRPQDLLGRHDQPDACTQCHVDRTRAWAADALATWSGAEALAATKLQGGTRLTNEIRTDAADTEDPSDIPPGETNASPSIPATSDSRFAVHDLPQVVLDLHGGDPIQRALAAHALARPEPPVPTAQRMAWLVDALEDDYPAVRWFAFRGLRRLAAETSDVRALAILETTSMMEDPGLRTVAIDELRAHLGPGLLADRPELAAALHERRDDQAIWIGE